MARRSTPGALAGTPALGAIAPSGSRLGRRRCLPRAPRHISLGAEDARKQAGDGQIGLQRFPMQAVARPEDLDLRELRGRRRLQPLCLGRRERESAAVGQFDNDAAGLAVVAGDGGAWFKAARSFRARRRRRFGRLSTQPWISRDGRPRTRHAASKHASNSMTMPGGSSAMLPPRTIRVRNSSPSSLA